MTITEARALVFARDGGCIAPSLDREAGPCGDQWGRPLDTVWLPHMELDRIREAPTMGKAPSHHDPTHMVGMCARHHRGMGATGGMVWATSHREPIRAYLRACHPEAWSG